jgi:sulfur-oxidizing protein SoxZ
LTVIFTMAEPTNFPIRLTVTGAVQPGASLKAVLLIGHPMESGFRTMESGQLVPKNVIETLLVRLNDITLFQASTGIGISANPYFAFPVDLPQTTPPTGWYLSVNWVDDKGQRGELKRELR